MLLVSSPLPRDTRNAHTECCLQPYRRGRAGARISRETSRSIDRRPNRGYHTITHGTSAGIRVGRHAARKGARRMKRWQLTIALVLGCMAAALLTAPTAQTGDSPAAKPT